MKVYLPVIRVLSMVIFIFGLTMLVPVGVSWVFQDGAARAFDEAILLTLGVGLVLWGFTRRNKRDLTIRDGFLMVALVWTVLPVFAALPLIFYLDASFTDAYFEAVSGLTTTGATVFSELDKLPVSINFWRTQLVWLGGMGLIVLAVAILPLLGIGGRQMFKAETPGPMKDSKMTPRIAETAKGLWGVYTGITVCCFLAYHWAGMSWMDAIMHSFSTMGLGGFSSHDASFGYFNSPTIETVSIVFMLIAGMNFATHFVALSGRSIRPYITDPEAVWFLVVALGSVLGIAVFLNENDVYRSFSEAFRYSAFNVVSIATTTGYANTDYYLWPMFAPLWMLFLSSFATSAGSTGGGIKMIRALVLYKQVNRELLRAIHPDAVYLVRIGSEVVPGNILFAVLAFGFMYMVSIVSMTLLMSLSGLDIITAFSAVVASINNTGPGLNQVGPATTFEVLNDFQTWICTFAMLLGRLEIFTLLVVFTPAFWRR
ncbi:Trk system potassium uptake protein TrkH [Candidatus Propionivibrio aalborgensis]|jgi:trk system potassium uptake protein TrkH|uniref:Trk system potassium uptake protein n=1 Tax=Candidatus Propionivibrio aalborgensis TaxID=1860101 RepID=A0A1A8XW40_9RHOO|nr:potassium transporter TrkG [Candidatus Propionivibrio aalborgensis]MBK7325704.1 TrkH family potassium uptake protein [Propionivibrio sp.]MBK7565535.1 TrkH family potassium uptake protein [Propionivibrio sp.]MBP6422026.1 TrkH family potassium uptake protein [Propionivibrio sp.]SBT08817.1 Trk system potassium uptake protein TrkH [Candidatus Propionivibrio aalborgensis]HRC59465.1 potassium transporter TrkG [Candidatus Propionivibrio aalborgensis]